MAINLQLHKVQSSIGYLLFLVLSSFPFALYANHDTLYTCRPGEPIQLQVDTTFAGYRWFPTTGLNNPTIATPEARPLITTTYVVETIGASGANLIPNGDFSEGNRYFTSRYVYSPGANPTQGVYGIFPDANNLSPQYFSHCRDHTDGRGNLMAVDGSPQANVEVWCQSIEVMPNTTYGFSTWVTSIYPPNPARLQFSINGLPLGQPFNAGIEVCEWRQFYATWSSGEATEAQICIVNQNTDPNGNDFALDDFAFFELGEIAYDTFTVIVESNSLTRIDTTVCAGSSVAYNGTFVPAGTTEQFRFTSVHGCDSLVQLTVGVLDTIFEFILIDTLCPGETLEFFGHTIVQDTVICETFPISPSCDSTYCLTAVFLTETALETEAVNPTCAGAADGRMTVTPRAGLPPYAYRWSGGANTPSISGLKSGTYRLQVTDAKGCVAERTIELAEPPPLVAEVIARSKLCNGETNGILELGALGGTPPYEYSIDNGAQFYPGPSLQRLALGNYEVLVRDANGCEARQEIIIPPPAVIELFAPPPVRVPLGESVSVAIQTNTAEMLVYEWTPTEDLSCPTCPATDVLPLRSTDYKITATDPDGCRWTTNWSVEVFREPDVYIPNAFSPNGDGQNDYFAVYTGPSIVQIKNLQIFDRWGNLLFQVKECPAGMDACRWDGRSGGQLSAAGVFVYTCVVEYIDGETGRFEGGIVLLR